jgi:hypothetical protein
MGFDKTTGTTEYDMTVFLTPLGVEKFYSRGMVDGTKFFSVSDADVNYLAFSGLTYNYNMVSGGTYSPNQPTVGYILNLRGTVDRNQVIEKKALGTNIMSLRSPVWQYPTVESVEQILSAYKLSNSDKYFDKPIVLGSRNMWHKTLSTVVNKAEGFLYYLPPSHATPNYTGTTEPTMGTVTTGATDYVPFPGVSVNDGRRSYTEIQYFYYLNKTNKHMFFDSFSVSNILPTTHTVIQTLTDENYSSEFVKQSHYLEWESIKDGKRYVDGVIHVFIPKFVYNQSRIVLFPFEVVRFGVSFEIYQAGSVVTHWRGQNYSDQLAREGQYEFDLVLTSKPEIGSTTIYTAAMKVVAKVKDSAYNASTYIPPTPIGGGGSGVEINNGGGSIA